jgi:hypothetical protein
VAWKGRPLRLAFAHNCIFRQGVQALLDARGIVWEMAVESESTRAVEASVSADLAVHAALAGSEPPYVERINHGGTLPDLAKIKVNMYVADPVHSNVVLELGAMIKAAYQPRAGRPVVQERADNLMLS